VDEDLLVLLEPGVHRDPDEGDETGDGDSPSGGSS
jgi:hypothetical protein